MNVSPVNNIYQGIATVATLAALPSGRMVRLRPVHNEALGAYLVELRGNKKQKEVAELAQRRGLRALTRQVLLRLERGQIKNPEPDVLRAVASLYRVSYRDLVERFVVARFAESDLTGHVPDQRSDPSEGRVDVPASPAIEARDLESLSVELRTEATKIAARLVVIAGKLEASATTRSNSSTESVASRRGRTGS